MSYNYVVLSIFNGPSIQMEVKSEIGLNSMANGQSCLIIFAFKLIQKKIWGPPARAIK